MTYYSSHDTAKSRHVQFLLDALIKLSNMVPTKTSTFGRPYSAVLPVNAAARALGPPSRFVNAPITEFEKLQRTTERGID